MKQKTKHPGLFKPKYRDENGTIRESAVIWMRYSCRGCPKHPHGGQHRQSTEKTGWTDAKRELDAKKGNVADRRRINTDADRLTMNNLFDDVINDYTIKQKRSLPDLKDRIKNHLLKFFGGIRAIDLDSAAIRAYQAARQKDAANGTINRETSIISRAFTLNRDKLQYVPIIEKLPELNAKGDIRFTDSDFQTFIDKLPDDVRRPVVVAWITAWRTPSEILQLRPSNVDLNRNCLFIETSKNGEGKVFPLIPELKEVIKEQQEANQKFQKKNSVILQTLFHNDGEPLAKQNNRGTIKLTRYFRDAWDTACTEAKIVKTPHDLCRAAMRNMRKRGLTEREVMLLSGRKTVEVIRKHYDQMSEEDAFAAAEKLTLLQTSKVLAK